MVSFEQGISDLLCDIRNVLKRSEIRETSILSITIPETPTIAAQSREFAVGVTKINFLDGVITNPNGTTEIFIHSNNTLQRHDPPILRSITVEPDNDIVLTIHGLDGTWSYATKGSYLRIGTYLQYTGIEITCSTLTNIQIFTCTNPQATLSVFSKSAAITTTTQDAITVDNTEAQTYDTPPASLLGNLNRMRNRLNAIVGETNWYDAPGATIKAIWAKFHATTGHKHSGAANDAPLVPWANVDKTTSSIADITTKSHTALSDIGTNTHAQLDTQVGTTLPGLVTTHAALTKSHGLAGTATIVGITTGTYTGDGTQNRAIAHGLGVVPKVVFITKDNGSYHFMGISTGYLHYAGGGGSPSVSSLAQTNSTSTNFYVGASTDTDAGANKSSQNYSWVALA